MINTLEPYHQTYTYDLGNNLTHLSHQAKSNTWQQTLAIHPSNNRGTETQQSTSDFDANGNLLVLNNIGTLHQTQPLQAHLGSVQKKSSWGNWMELGVVLSFVVP